MPANEITQRVDAILAAKQASALDAVFLAEARLVDHLLRTTGNELLKQMATSDAIAVVEITAAGQTQIATLTPAQALSVFDQFALTPGVSLAPPSEAKRAYLEGHWPYHEDALIAVMTARTPPELGEHLTLWLQLLPSEPMAVHSHAA